MSEKIKTVMALGLFDSVHKGHKKVISTAVKIAEDLNVVPSVFTFKGDLKSAINKNAEKPVYDFCDRIALIKELGVKEIFAAGVVKEILDLDKTEFLNLLTERYDIVGFVSGEDFTFGKNGAGNKTDLAGFSAAKKIKYISVPLEKSGGIKISTTEIKRCLLSGDVKSANELLGEPFFKRGIVYKDRGVGRTIGFPTANIKISEDVISLPDAVYAGRGYVCGKSYPAIINCGSRPTFDDYTKTIEAYLDGLDYDVYGEELKIEFTDKIRDIKKFDSAEALTAQLKKDLEKIRGKNYD